MKRNCPCCGGDGSKLILANRWVAPTKCSFHDGYDIVECNSCGAVYADNIPEPAVINAYYSEQSQKAQGHSPADWREMELVLALHRGTKKWITENITFGERLLDIGCFTGDTMAMFKDEKKVFGYDPSRMGHEVARIQHGVDTEIAGRFRDTSFSKNGDTFDLAIASHVVEHIADVEVFFGDIRPALGEDGQLYIEVPDVTNFFISSDERYHLLHCEPMLQFAAEHVNFFSPASLRRMMTRLGYDCIKCESRADTLAVISSVWKPHSRSDDAKHVSKYYDDCLAAIEKLNITMREVRGPVYVWGAGGHSQRMLQYGEMAAMPIVAFIESSVDYQGGTLAGRPIIGPAEIDKPYPIIISSLLYQDAIVAQIKGMGIQNQVITLYRTETR